MKHALAQPRKCSPSRHQAFKQLQLVPFSLTQASVVRQRESCYDRRFVSFSPQNNALSCADLASCDLGKPAVALVSCTGMHQVPKFLDHLLDRPGSLTGLTTSREGGLLFFIESGWITHKQPNGILGGAILHRHVGAPRFLPETHVLASRKQEAMNLSFLL